MSDNIYPQPPVYPMDYNQFPVVDYYNPEPDMKQYIANQEYTEVHYRQMTDMYQQIPLIGDMISAPVDPAFEAPLYTELGQIGYPTAPNTPPAPELVNADLVMGQPVLSPGLPTIPGYVNENTVSMEMPRKEWNVVTPPSMTLPTPYFGNYEGPFEPIRVSLKDPINLWKLFNMETTEMLVRANGRSIFPLLTFKVTGLAPNVLYSMSIKLVKTSVNKMVYKNGLWTDSKKPDGPIPEETNEIFSDEAKSGKEWMEEGISFENVKIFNNRVKKAHPNDRENKNPEKKLVVNSMVRYRPAITVYDRKSGTSCGTFFFDNTEFIVVTKYINPRMAALKAQHNKFAVGALRNKNESDE